MKKKLNDVITIRVFREQYKDIQKTMKNYPDIWISESHFIRSAINYFIRHIQEGKFKIIME